MSIHKRTRVAILPLVILAVSLLLGSAPCDRTSAAPLSDDRFDATSALAHGTGNPAHFAGPYQTGGRSLAPTPSTLTLRYPTRNLPLRTR
jgi:hypothetical protein